MDFSATVRWVDRWVMGGYMDVMAQYIVQENGPDSPCSSGNSQALPVSPTLS